MKTIIATLLFFLLIKDANACDCFYNGPFIKVAPTADLVALVQVKRYVLFSTVNNKQTPLAMEVEIITKYKGNNTSKTVRVWGDDGNMCRPFIDTFAIGKKFVLALKSIKAGAAQGQEKPGDYFVDACGGYWLSLQKNDILKGDYDGHSKQTSSQKLTRLFRSKG